jgi:hypothetical protein
MYHKDYFYIIQLHSPCVCVCIIVNECVRLATHHKCNARYRIRQYCCVVYSCGALREARGQSSAAAAGADEVRAALIQSPFGVITHKTSGDMWLTAN